MAMIRRESTLSTNASRARAQQPAGLPCTGLAHRSGRVFLQIVPAPIQYPCIFGTKPLLGLPSQNGGNSNRCFAVSTCGLEESLESRRRNVAFTPRVAQRAMRRRCGDGTEGTAPWKPRAQSSRQGPTRIPRKRLPAVRRITWLRFDSTADHTFAKDAVGVWRLDCLGFLRI